jgi:hypothetical protein
MHSIDTMCQSIFYVRLPRDVCVPWIIGQAFYLIDFRVAKEPPKVDLDKSSSVFEVDRVDLATT